MKKCLATFLALLCSLSASALPLTWRADWPDCKPVESLVHRGTDVELRPTWYINGAPAASTNWTLTTYVQTNAVGQWFGPLPGAFFSHTNDVGAAFYNVMVRAQAADGGVNYTAFARFRMLDSPGFTPGELPLPAKVIDFADVTVLNAPWPDASITNGLVAAEAATNIAEAAAAAATNGIPRITEGNTPGWAENADYAQSTANAAVAGYATEAALAERIGNVGESRDFREIFSQLDAATETNAAQAAEIAALRDDATLTPSYQFSDWVLTGFPEGTTYTVRWVGNTEYPYWLVQWAYPDLTADSYFAYDVSETATEFTIDGLFYLGQAFDVNASRTRTVVGYTLGSQTNMPIQAAGDYAQASVLADMAETATNALETAGAAAAASSTNSENIATLNAQVSSIGAYLNAEDAHFVSTNYDSLVNLPEAYVEIKMRDESTGSNTWITIWQEMRRWTAFVGGAFNWQSWQGFHTWATNITHELSFKADRCWGIYDSETGGYSPNGYTQISSSNILIAAGMAYQRTITSGGAVWVLQCNQGVAQMGGDTNGFFQVFDGDGVVQFEIVKGDKREVGCNASGITVDNSYSPAKVTIPYSIISDEHPTLQICDNLKTANWKAETDPYCIATVEWSGLSGAWVATVQLKGAGLSDDAMFVKASYMAGGETYIRNAAPVSMDSIMLNGTRYYLGTATISGHTVLTLSTTPPAP